MPCVNLNFYDSHMKESICWYLIHLDSKIMKEIAETTPDILPKSKVFLLWSFYLKPGFFFSFENGVFWFPCQVAKYGCIDGQVAIDFFGSFFFFSIFLESDKSSHAKQGK